MTALEMATDDELIDELLKRFDARGHMTILGWTGGSVSPEYRWVGPHAALECLLRQLSLVVCDANDDAAMGIDMMLGDEDEADM